MKSLLGHVLVAVAFAISVITLTVFIHHGNFPQPLTVMLVALTLVSLEYHARYQGDLETKFTPEQMRNIQKLLEAEGDCFWAVKR